MRKFTCAPLPYAARPGAGFQSSFYIFPHDLGVTPYIVRIFMQCLVTDQGYPVGSIVPVGPHAADELPTGVPGGFVATGLTIQTGPTVIEVSFDTNHGFSMHQFNTKKNGRINNGAWHMIVKVFAP